MEKKDHPLFIGAGHGFAHLRDDLVDAPDVYPPGPGIGIGLDRERRASHTEYALAAVKDHHHVAHASERTLVDVGRKPSAEREQTPVGEHVETPRPLDRGPYEDQRGEKQTKKGSELSSETQKGPEQSLLINEAESTVTKRDCLTAFCPGKQDRPRK